jgi:hypothetical protein
MSADPFELSCDEKLGVGEEAASIALNWGSALVKIKYL